eukprot:42546_1
MNPMYPIQCSDVAVYGDSATEQKQSEDRDDSEEEPRLTEPFSLPIFVVQSDMTLRALRLRYHYDSVLHSGDYFWISFRVIQSIYPTETRTMKISLDRIQCYEQESV